MRVAKEFVFTAVADERRKIAALIDDLDDAQLATPSLCTGWDVKTVAAHLVSVFADSFWVFQWTAIRCGGVHRAIDELARRRAQQPAVADRRVPASGCRSPAEPADHRAALRADRRSRARRRHPDTAWPAFRAGPATLRRLRSTFSPESGLWVSSRSDGFAGSDCRPAISTDRGEAALRSEARCGRCCWPLPAATRCSIVSTGPGCQC